MTDKMKLLYVDDEQINLELFIINFNKKYDVHVANNGSSGLEELEQNPSIRVVISDMKMPFMSGLEFIVKAKEKFPDIKYYILTGVKITMEIKAAIKNGLILKCFTKPFNMQEIESSVNGAMD